MSATWMVISKTSKAKTRARIVEERITSFLLSDPDAAHVLPGEHGRRVLEAIAEAWNRSGYQTSNNFTRCRGDCLSESARRNFTLSIS